MSLEAQACGVRVHANAWRARGQGLALQVGKFVKDAMEQRGDEDLITELSVMGWP